MSEPYVHTAERLILTRDRCVSLGSTQVLLSHIFLSDSLNNKITVKGMSNKINLIIFLSEPHNERKCHDKLFGVYKQLACVAWWFKQFF